MKFWGVLCLVLVVLAGGAHAETTWVEQQNGAGVSVFQVSLASGETSDALLLSDFLLGTLRALPGSGCTLSVKHSMDLPSVVSGGSPTWTDWDNGAVTSAAAANLFVPVTAIICSASGGDGVCQFVVRRAR